MARGKAADSPLRSLRTRRGLSQEDVAARISELTGEEVGQAAVSYWELGKVDFKKVHPRRLRAYAEVLGVTTTKLAETINVPEEELFFESPVSPPEPRPLPDGLQSAIDVYGKRFSDLQDPAWQQYMAKFRWRTGQPEDAEAWLDLYRDLSRAGIVPGEN